MKSSGLALIFVCTLAFRGFSQGTVYFSNLYGQQVNAPVFSALEKSLRKFALTVLLSLMGISAHGQGTILFQNYPLAAGVDAPVYESDRVTPVTGAQFTVQLLAGASPTTLAPIATTGFFTGSQAGYFNGGQQSVPGVIRGNSAWVEVQVWNLAAGSSFNQAQNSSLPDSWWESSIFSVTAGGGIVDPSAAGPLTGLGTSPVFLNGATVPEPSALALGLAALAVMFLCLPRRTNR